MILFVLGTRPEIVKLAPILRECKERDIEFMVVHTGQHYSEKMDGVFFKELEVPEPDYNLEVGSGPNSVQIGRMLAGLDNVLRKEMPDIVVVQGDTNSTVAGGLAGSNLGIPVAYVESGLRSFDMEMQEERNRVIVSHIADIHFAPTGTSRKNLESEGVKENVFVVGNTVVDACMRNIEVAEKRYECELGDFALMTLHRAENVDSKERLRSIVKGVKGIGIDVVYPIHPRARKRMKEYDIDTEGIKVVEPMGYLEFLYHLKNARFVVTDSGGVVEEAATLKIPTICVRESTDRPEAVEAGICVMAGADPVKIKELGDRLADDEKFRDSMASAENPYGDGRAAKRIVDRILGFLSANY